MKTLIHSLVIFGFVFSLHAQKSSIDYQQIENIGKSFNSRLKSGDIEHLKKMTPPEGTWTYPRLLDYKKELEEDSPIIIGSYIEPSRNKNVYAYNLFALINRGEIEGYEYFFSSILSIDISKEKYRIKNAFLFTENEALKNWWMHTIGFYEGDDIKDIPEEFVYKVCPPPPFK
ncbi:hypothetical protein Q2T40_17765 [Winogradskyella maritima]|uniref:DUF985 domain-containing protein n=1 Tax=Winogradskyella maritima TaxID=1517766 RepID=A0ABV8AHQ0_9FLAO|nr:hypothetical protein [Winogradskyella maritima]